MFSLADTHILELSQYIPGKAVKETQTEIGVDNIIKLASNENPFGPSPVAVSEALLSLSQGHIYPNTGRIELKQQICCYHAGYKLGPQHIVLGNGANELIMLLVRAFVGTGQNVLTGWPSFIVYRLAASSHGRTEIPVPLTASLDYDLKTMLEIAQDPTENVKMIFLANPNNPTGKIIPKGDLRQFINSLPVHIIAVIDEAYAEFVHDSDYAESIDWVLSRPRTVILRTFSKIYGLAGFRIGYAISDPEISNVLHRVRDPFNVSGVALAAARGALNDPLHREKTLANNARELPRVSTALVKLGLEVTPSAANFLLFHLPQHMKSMTHIIADLMNQGILIRPLTNYGLHSSARVTIGLPHENDRFLRALALTL